MSDDKVVISLADVEECTEKVENLLLKFEASSVDPRWAAIARTQFQQAFMAARAVIFCKGRKL